LDSDLQKFFCLDYTKYKKYGVNLEYSDKSGFKMLTFNMKRCDDDG
jgi:hypothetical protein